MVISNSVVRIYTPPTCTLKIVGKSSPLARWVGGTVLKKMRFELRFDDPRKHKDQQIKVNGEQEDLALLSEVVTDYVQKFLHRSALDLPLLIPETTTLEHSFSEVLNHQSDKVVPFPDIKDSELEGEPEDPKISPMSPPPFARGPRLEPKGLLAHQLHLGYLGGEEVRDSIALSTTQLFDLATALDEYAEDIVALPFLKDSDRSVVPYWAGTAAAVVMAVGLTAIGMKTFNSSPEATTVAQNEADTPQAPIGIVPQAPAPEVSPTPTPTLPSILQSKEKLKPPGAVKRGDNESSPTSTPTQQGNNNQSGGSRTEKRQVATVPGQPPIVPRSRQGSVPSGVPSAQPINPPRVGPAQPVIPPNVRPAPSEVRPSVPSRTDNTPSIPSLPPLDSKTTADVNGDLAFNNPPTAGLENRLEDVIPQVAEARNYFQGNWNPPQGVNKPLEYRLVLNRNGSLNRVVPLGQAANINIKSTNMPTPGEQFVSPFPEEGNTTIRLVLFPDRRVQTFLE